MTRREKKDYRTEPINILEVHPGSFQKRPITEADPDGFLNYKQLAHALGDYAEEMGYAHVELLGILESSLRRVLGLSGNRVFCTYIQIWKSERFYVSGGLPAPERDRRVS